MELIPEPIPVPPAPLPDRILAPSEGKLLVLHTGEIDWVEAAGNYCRVHAGEAVHIIRQKISTMAEKLSTGQFLRIHRSVIVNLRRIRALQPCGHGEYTVILHDERELPVGGTYRDLVFKVLAR